MVCSKANENIMNSLEKLGLTSIGALDKSFLISTKDFLASTGYLKLLSFFNILFTYFTTSAKFVMNLLKKFTLPRND